MGSRSKGLAVALILVMAVSSASLLIVKPANAQALPQPSVPQFTLKFVDSSYVEAPVYSPNPYTGQNDLVQPSNYELNLSVEMIIKNQPFTPYIDAKGNQIVLLYNVEWKPHYSTDWNGFGANNSLIASNSQFVGPMSTALISPNAPTTIYHFGLGQNNATAPFTTEPDYGQGNLGIIPLNGQGQVDFRVEAFTGYETLLEAKPGDYYYDEYYPALITGPSSSFSEIQTITIPASSISASPSPTPTLTPAVPELSAIISLPLLLSVFSVAVIVRHRKTANSNQ